MASRRLPEGGSIDRGSPLRFRFDGMDREGFAGDTLASALLADGVDVLCPSPILGRPRGVMTAGVEEPCAFVEVSAPRFDLIAPATTVELVDGLVAEGRAGKGRLPAGAEPPRCDHRHARCEVLIVGGGVAGLAAAEEATRNGDRVMLVEERPWLGGIATTNQQMQGAPAWDWVARQGASLARSADVVVLTRATALGTYDGGYVLIHERSSPVEHLWHVRAGRVILATGAHERTIAFAENDRPGVMLASAVELYVDRFGLLPGERAIIFTTNDSAFDAAFTLADLDAGTEVVAVVDVRAEAPVHAAARERGLEVLAGWAVAGTDGSPRLSSVRVTDGRRERTIPADLLAVSGGWNPVVGLHRMIGGGLRYDEDHACFLPDGHRPDWLEVVGAAAGKGLPPAAPYWFVPADDLSRHFVDLQRDSTVADVAAALGAGFRSAEHVKRSTYIGTAIDQGRISGVLAAEVVNQLLGWDPGAQGPTSARPPSTPVPYATVAGPYRGQLLDPVRRTPIHSWHEDAGAVFENVGQWKRPRYFPQGGENMAAAVARESLAVRTAVGMMDASTLGKIEVVGPDAPTFLDRMYTNAMSTLRVGRIRYGMMLGLDGMVMDDGVAMRLADDRFLVTTTTGGAAGVLDHFEEWLQTEWPELRVYCTSVTEQWATVAVAGPKARGVLSAAETDVDLSAAGFPFMNFRNGTVAGLPARIARVSFSGELAYEINVAGVYGLDLWKALAAAGKPFGMAAYGTETMHVLRAEKGFPIVGQETDGTVTPYDLGMSWLVSDDKGDFVGRRSLRRTDTTRSDRKQLVGLLPTDPDVLLAEGAQLTLEGGEIAGRSAGHVTSSYASPVLGRTFALGMLKRGSESHGLTVHARHAGRAIAAEVTAPVFFDPEGRRRDG